MSRTRARWPARVRAGGAGGEEVVLPEATRAGAGMLGAMPVDVSIIVVTWNARDLVDRCLAAATGPGSAGVVTETIVVDNDSSDDTVAHVRAAWPAVRIVETGRNGGMAAGNNAGVLAAEGRAFLLLNSDCFLDEGAVRAMLGRLDADVPGDRQGDPVGVVVPRLRNEDGSLQRSVRGWPTPWRLFTEFFFVRRLFPRARWANAFYAAGFDHDGPATDIEWATGACLLVSRAAIDDVGLMDESYFMYGEEVDWLSRLDEAGWVVAYEPQAGATHLGGGSAGRAWGRMFALQCANHVVLQSRIGGHAWSENPARRRAAAVRAARRTRRIVASGLRLRIALSYLGVVRGGASRSPAQRRAVLREALAAVRAVDPSNVPEPVVPGWPGAGVVQRPESPAR